MLLTVSVRKKNSEKFLFDVMPRMKIIRETKNQLSFNLKKNLHISIGLKRRISEDPLAEKEGRRNNMGKGACWNYN